MRPPCADWHWSKSKRSRKSDDLYLWISSRGFLCSTYSTSQSIPKRKENVSVGPVPRASLSQVRIWEGMSQQRACPKHFGGPVPRAGLSQEFRRACSKSGPVPSILKSMSQKRACPTHFEGRVPRVGLSRAFWRAWPKSGPVRRI